MVTLYIKTTDDQIKLHSTKEREVAPLATSYNGSSQDRLWAVNSYVFSKEELEEKYDHLGSSLNVIDAYLLGKELQPEREVYDSFIGSNITVSFDNTMSLTVDEAKTAKINEIDAKTQSLIFQGFDYSGVNGSTLFSLSGYAQSNWSFVRIQRDNGIYSSAGPGVNITALDDSEYILPRDEIVSFTNEAFDVVKGNIDEGRAIKASVLAASNISAISEIQDNR